MQQSPGCDGGGLSGTWHTSVARGPLIPITIRLDNKSRSLWQWDVFWMG